ncbi:MAG: aminotransferase class V-fold PLP-dependent enzyme, partial [Anaerolineales bacterium]
AHLTGHPSERLPNHASFVFDGVDGNALLMQLDLQGIACSSGSACKTGNPSPSEVLLALGIPAERALGSLRVTLGRWTSAEEINTFVNALPEIINQNRKLYG